MAQQSKTIRLVTLQITVHFVTIEIQAKNNFTLPLTLS
jgi:hypothetical protein